MIFLTVGTGFQGSEITVSEGNFGKMCLTTVGQLFYDAVINVTVMEGSAGSDGNAHYVTNVFKMLKNVGMEVPKRV